MNDFIAPDVGKLLDLHGLDSFEALWALQLNPVDEPNTERGGWSSVCRLELKGDNADTETFYLKRQCNHQSLSWRRPLGEPTFAREWRNIYLYQQRGIPALTAAFFAERNSAEGRQAVLMTRALDDYAPLSVYLEQWQQLPAERREQMLGCIGEAVAQLHGAGLTHHCLYPKHIYIALDQVEPVRFIDLEKTRTQLLVWRERVADLDALLRRCKSWVEDDRELFLREYLRGLSVQIPLSVLQKKLFRRHRNKTGQR